MAVKPKYIRLESEIERYRVEGNWNKALDGARQLASKNHGHDFIIHFVIAEQKLEAFIKDNSPVEKHVAEAKEKLAETEKSLSEIVKGHNKLSLEANLLLAKLHYCMGKYEAAVDIFNMVNLDKLSSDVSTRLLQILAESYAVKGLCLEALGPNSTSKFKIAEHEDKVVTCYEVAGELALLFLQEKEKGLNQNNLSGSQSNYAGQDDRMGSILETAIQQAPILCIKKGDIAKGVTRFRELLRIIESRSSQSLRQTLARQLAEVLLRGMTEKTYVPLDLGKSTKPTGRRESDLKPRKYSGDRLFVPQDMNEETLLLLLIAEAIATREAVLNRSEEHKEARQHSFDNTTAVYDLLAIALVKRTQFNKLSDSFEKAMRFSFEEFHIWHQFANSLICSGKYTRALLVLKECSRLKPKNLVVLLQAAKLCYEYLHLYGEGIKLVEQAIEESDDDHPLCARLYVALGIGFSLRALEMKLQAERHESHRKAMENFKKAHTLDPNDFLALFHLALQLAIQRQIVDAMKYVRLALRYRQGHIHSLHLLVLLLTSQKQYDEAMTLIKAALEEYPDNLSLLLTKCKLEEVILGPEVALTTCKQMLKLWKDLYETDVDETSSEKPSRTPTGIDRATFDRRSFAQLQLSELHDRDTGSLRAESVAASRVEQTLSEVASSFGSIIQQRSGSQQTLLLQAQIWLHLAELYLSLGKTKDAEACVQETSAIFPLSHQVSYMKGRVLEHKQKYEEAQSYYENAISINPAHTKSLQHLGIVLHQLDNNKMAEKVLRDSVNVDPTSHQSWYMLGLALESLDQEEAASQCHLTALELESTSPIVPFTIIPRLLQ